MLITLETDVKARSAGSSGKQRERSAVFYRMPVPGMLRVYRQGQDVRARNQGVAREFLLTTLREVSLLHPDMPATPLPVHPSAWSKRTATITLSDSYRPKKLGWESGATAANVTSSLAEAAREFRDESVEAAEQLADYRENLRDARLADLQDAIEELEKEKERLDGRIALQGAIATADQELERVKL